MTALHELNTKTNETPRTLERKNNRKETNIMVSSLFQPPSLGLLTLCKVLRALPTSAPPFSLPASFQEARFWLGFPPIHQCPNEPCAPKSPAMPCSHFSSCQNHRSLWYLHAFLHNPGGFINVSQC
jgi:hypothetical protein